MSYSINVPMGEAGATVSVTPAPVSPVSIVPMRHITGVTPAPVRPVSITVADGRSSIAIAIPVGWVAIVIGVGRVSITITVRITVPISVIGSSQRRADESTRCKAKTNSTPSPAAAPAAAVPAAAVPAAAVEAASVEAASVEAAPRCLGWNR
jgi:hypothetical protein